MGPLLTTHGISVHVVDQINEAQKKCLKPNISIRARSITFSHIVLQSYFTDQLCQTGWQELYVAACRAAHFVEPFLSFK